MELTSDVDSVGTFDVVVNAKVAGPRLGKDVQRVIQAVKAGNYERVGDTVVADGIELNAEEYTERLVAADPDSTARIDGLDGLVVLDMTLTEELEAEGWAADVIRGLQDARKATGLEVSDRITVELSVPADKEEWANRHRDLIAQAIPALGAEDVLRLRRAVLATHASDALVGYVQALLNRSRHAPGVRMGLSPRAGIALLRAARAHALLAGRDHVLPEDVQALFVPVAAHRLVPESDAGDGTTLAEAILRDVAVD